MNNGDYIKCIKSNEVMEADGIVVGSYWQANSVLDLTGVGDKIYVQVYTGTKIVVCLASNFVVVTEEEVVDDAENTQEDTAGALPNQNVAEARADYAGQVAVEAGEDEDDD